MADETLRRLVRTARQYSQSTEIAGQFLTDLTQEEYAQVVLAECQRRSSEGIRPWVITHLLKSLSDEDYSAIILPESRRRSNANRIPFPTNVEQWATRHVVPPATLNIGVGGTWLTSFQVGWGVWLPKEREHADIEWPYSEGRIGLRFRRNGVLVSETWNVDAEGRGVDGRPIITQITHPRIVY